MIGRTLAGLAAGAVLALMAVDGVRAAQPIAAPAFKPQPGRALCRGAEGYARDFEGRRTFFWRPEWLRARKRGLAADAAARAALRKAADHDLTGPRLSVRDKTATPASGDKGDYYSIGPYWWPDPAKPDGLPYVRRDGVRNPQLADDTFDAVRLGRFADRVTRLALASYYLDDPRYARGAAMLIRAWFLDPATRMNPNLNHGQSIPGVATGRAEGLIELPALAQVIDAIGVIAPTGVLAAQDMAGLQTWFARFTTWMTDSPIGRDERGRTNNHGLFYDFLLTDFALFAGRTDLARTVARGFPARLVQQMDATGALPQELARTRSWSYSVFALSGASRMATVGECVGVDIWSARTPDGRGLTRGLDYLLPYQSGVRRWPHRDLGLDDGARPADLRAIGSDLFRIAAWGAHRPDYDRAAPPVERSNGWLAPLPTERR